MATTKDLYATKFHRDRSVTVWHVYQQRWIRTANPSDKILASLDPEERSRVMRHCGILTAEDMTMREYQISGYSVYMTDSQAERWNAGESTELDLRRVKVAIPEPQNQCRYVSLRRATNERLSPETAKHILNMPATPVR